MTETKKIQPLGIKTAVAIGYFDGIHIGHRMILDNAVKLAGQMKLSPAVFTFDMSGKRSTGKGSGDLIPQKSKKKLISKLGIEQYVSPDFGEICDLSGKEFVDRILSSKCLNAAAVVCGNDFRFGKDRSCGVRELRKLCGSYGIQVFPQDALMLDGERVSSSRIKAALQKGDIQLVNRMLGYTYFISGTIVGGNHKAHELGFPTANMKFPENCVLPRKGVYVSDTEIDGFRFRSITNIGTRPTLTDDEEAVVETHIIDFDEDVYGCEATVSLLKFLRPEQKFDSVDELISTVNMNIETARSLVFDERTIIRT